MDDDSLRNWGYYELPVKSHMSLQLMSYDRDTKPFLPSHDHNPAIVPSNGSYHSRDCVATEHPVTDVELVRDSWINHREKFLHMFLGKPHNPVLAESRSGLHQPMQMVHPSHQQPDLPKETRASIEEPLAREGGPKLGHAKKRGSNSALKPPKAKKQMKRPSLKENGGTNNSNTNTNANINTTTTTTTNNNNNNNNNKNNSNKSAQRAKKNVEVVINGVDMDITGIPIPVCSCTGAPQQCYRWGCGGWQSACCTTTISMYPLPMSTKRRGARIAGRKMSQGAFKKVLENLAGEGYDFANPIDLRTYWAKHGTNKFVIIR